MEMSALRARDWEVVGLRPLKGPWFGAPPRTSPNGYASADAKYIQFHPTFYEKWGLRPPFLIKTMAEVVGFEPTRTYALTVFKTAAIDHSATPPEKTLEPLKTTWLLQLGSNQRPAD